MLNTKNNKSIIEITIPKRKRIMTTGNPLTIVLSLLIAAIACCMLSGCGDLNELFILDRPVYPNGLNASEVGQLRAREIQRRQFGYDEHRHNDIDRINGLGIPLLTWRFGEGSSRPDLAKRYAIHKKNLQNINVSNTEIVKLLFGDGGKD